MENDILTKVGAITICAKKPTLSNLSVLYASVHFHFLSVHPAQLYDSLKDEIVNMQFLVCFNDSVK